MVSRSEHGNSHAWQLLFSRWREIPVFSGVVQQRLSSVQLACDNFPYENVVIAAGQHFMELAVQPAETVAALEWAFGGSAAKPLFAVLLGLELCLAALLLALVRPRVVLTATSVTFGVFLLWIGYLIRTDAPVSCGCGTASLFGIANDDLHAAFVRTSVLFVWTLAALVSATIYTRGPRAGAASRTEMEDFRCDPVHPS